MRDSWKEYKIGDVAEVIGGGTPSTKEADNFGGTIPWLTPKDLSGYPYRYISHGERNITEKGLSNSSAKLLPAKTVLLTTRAPVGYVAIAKNPVTTNQGFRSLVLWEGFNHEFFYYLLKSNTEYLKNHASGTTFGELSGSTLKSLSFIFPSFPEQKAIASILGSLDDKIELNRKMNETLESTARAIFKSWFVDFDPIPGFGPHKEWQDSPLGKIPKEWRVSTIGDMIELAYGRALKEEIRQPGKIPVYGSNGQVGWHNEKLVEGPGVVVGRKGNPGIVTWVPIDFYPIDTTFYVVPKSIIKSMHYLFHALKLQDIASLGADSAVPGLNRNMAYMNKMLVPSSDIVSAFDKQVKPLADKVKHNNDQSLTLAMIRNALLPKLLSGEIRVKGAERFVEATS